MICYKCGKKVDDGDKFCRFCGTFLNKPKENLDKKNKPKDGIYKHPNKNANKSVNKPVNNTGTKAIINPNVKPLIKPTPEKANISVNKPVANTTIKTEIKRDENDRLKTILVHSTVDEDRIINVPKEEKNKTHDSNDRPLTTNSKLKSIVVNSPELETKKNSEEGEKTSFIVEVLLVVIILGVVISLVIFDGGRNKVYCEVLDSDNKKIKDMEYYLYSGNSKVSLYVERIYKYYNDKEDAEEYYNKRKNDCNNIESDLERCFYSINDKVVIKTIEKDFINYQKRACKNKEGYQKKECVKSSTQCLNTNCVRYNNKEVLTLAEDVLASGNSNITVKCK